MPIYEYRCRACGRPASIFFRSLAVVEADPACPGCGARALERRISRVWVHAGGGRNEEAEFTAADMPTGDGFDDYGEAPYGAEDDVDPAEFAREARAMARMMGEPLGDDFESALEHIEQGADPEDVLGEMDAAAPLPEDEP